MAAQYSQYSAVQPLHIERDTLPFRQDDAWTTHLSMADRRRAPAHLPPCLEQDQREHASPYPRSSCSLPRINDLFASQQLISPTPTSACKTDATRPLFGRSQSDYRPNPSQCSPQWNEDHSTSKPHRKADIASLLNNTDEDDRRSWPSNESASALRSATVSPSSDPRPQHPRCDSPFEPDNLRRGPLPMPAQDFAPATYVYQSTAYEGVQNIPGLGPHHVYAGGYCVPTHVLGEAVNPYWGLTKGKVPRKRLSVACSTCRKKKIRCEPSLGGCLQCKKAQRPCCVEAVKRRRTRVSASSDVDMSDEKDVTTTEKSLESRPDILR